MPEHIDRQSGSAPDGPSTLPSTCTWVVGPPSPTATCQTHGMAYPWHTPPGCTLPAATLCHLCLRDIVPVRHRFTWTFLCPTCARIETTLAAPFGATALTPHTGQSGAQAATVFGLRHPHRVHQTEVVEVSVVDGRPSTVTRDRLDGPDPLTPLRAHASALLASMASGRVGFDEWVLTFPASARASAAAYIEFVDERHPWIVDLVPRVHDVDWLTRVAAGTGD